ncbi:MAG: sulfite reductase subunit alpha [Akkermansiaceae bacterium]|nr:sulfite reductase subunit alpha [Verrucomicrobiales bacterium]
MFSRVPAGGTAPAAAPAQPLRPLSILFGSQTGNAENLSKRMAREAGKRGFAPTIHELSKYPVAQLASEQRLLIVTSTFGDGEPPDNAKPFWDFLSSETAPKLAQTGFAICGLGDSNYPKFCGFARELDLRFEALGANRVLPRVDCDVEFEEAFARWLNEALTQIGAESKAGVSAAGETGGRVEPESSPARPDANVALRTVPIYSRANPFPALLVTNRKLNAPGSGKDTRHFEIALEGSGLSYEAGDALGVFPKNCPELVEELLQALHFSGGEAVPGREGTVPVREALWQHYEITRIPPPFLRVMAERSGDELLQKLTAPGVNGELTKFLWGREIIDVLLAHPAVKFTPIEFVGLLKKLNPRLYSISSSPKAHAGQVHVTVGIVRYESLSRQRKGVCSTFLADRVPGAEVLPVFLHSNKNFRPPQNPDVPMIMVGPGTGIAPFRGFLHERAAIGAKGKNWLFFGDQRSTTDFMYRDELEVLQQSGTLTRLDTAFSRDQAEKVYVQDRLREQGRELFNWLEQGAHFYVCGDASRMAKDVDAALHEVVVSAGGKTADGAKEYVAKLKAEKRYQRDVY